MSDETGKRIGDYQILNELGSGGMGRVYRVRNVISDRIEAMKVLLPDLAGRQELAERFLREIKLMAALNHPNLAALRTAFTADNQLVMIMEYVEGTTLAERLEHGPIPVPDAVNYIDQVLDALSYAHQQHVIHRDIKPSNMMLTPQGVIKLMDFGIARSGDERNLTMTGTTIGSLAYMSPEQVKGEPTDARSDLYSVGVSLYEMVTGQRPFQASSDYSIMSAHVKEAPRPPIELQPGLPPALNEIILMAIAKEPAMRFKSADAFRNALSSVRTTLSASQTTPVRVTPDAAVTATSLQTPIPTATPVPVPAVMSNSAVISNAGPSLVPPPPAQSGGHRGLYMTLGALIVLAVLVAAGIYIPRRSKTHAELAAHPPTAIANSGTDANSPNAMQPASSPQSSSTAPATDTASAAAQPMAPPAPPPNDAGSTGATQQQLQPAVGREVEAPAPPQSKSSPSKPAKKLSAKSSAAPPPAQDAASPASPQSAPADSAAEMDELEHQVDQLSSRAGAVNSSLDRLQQQQAASGYGLRGDMAARQSSLKNNLAKAEDAAQHGDVARAKRYIKMAESDVEALEHFLGR